MSADQVRFRGEYYSLLAAVEQKNFWFQSRNQLLFWALKTHYPRARSFLEIGCGTGFVLQGLRSAFPGLKLAGSEVLCDGLRYASQRAPEAMLFQMDARRIPFANEFDVIGAFDVLEHIEEDEVVLQQMHRAVKLDGGIMVTVPQHPWLWSAYDRADGHCRRYVRAELCQKVQQAGFRVVSVTSFVSLLLPLLLGARWARRTNGGDDTSELRIGRLVNGCLEMIMQLERWLIRAGISFPVGGSLLLVGRKV
jgi:SAM-dependent methyltransferase